MTKPYISATGITTPLSLTLNTSHSASCSMATIDCVSHSLEIGDSIDVYLGYDGVGTKVFTGYVKGTDKKTPNNTYTINAYDVMTRAVDYFIVSDNPDNPFKRRNISAEDLVEDVMALASLTDYNYDPTYFTFAINADAEVNLVSSYDYSKMIADLLTWHLYADSDGTVNFVNRKPHVMVAGSPESDQPGFVADPVGGIKTVNDSTILTLTHTKSEKDLRNRIVVYGSEGVFGNAQRATSFDPDTQSYVTVLPGGYHKSAVLATPIIDSDSIAEDAADYNLKLLNRLSVELSMTVIGDPDLMARSVIHVTNSMLNIDADYYIFTAEHNISNTGYTVNMLLRK